MFYWLTVCTPSFAGGGPENVFLVVNDRSWASRTVANHYASLREIPTANIFYLPWNGTVERIDIATFRENILKPIIAAMEKRGLMDQIDYIVYSSDFPYEVDYSKELRRAGKFNSGSLTGLTYLYELVLGNRSGELAGQNNFYANTSTALNSTRGFESSRQWARQSGAQSGRKYFLSTMLAYTSGRGNSIPQVVNYLKRSAAADSTQPDGTVYFMTNEDVRSKTRSNSFASVVQALERQGAKAEILEGVVPIGKPDVMGAMIGKSGYAWRKSRSTILPGAICENLTSFGGILRTSAGQTPLTESLGYGAAASSGTVIEPYAIQAKFPHPVMHLHYRRGVSLAEAFYLSVTSPYQLLIVGDPLCQPYARPPTVQIEGVTRDAVVSGNISIKPSVASKGIASVREYQIFVDGRLRKRIKPKQAFEFDSARMPDGYHELRVVALMSDPIRTQGRKIIPFTVSNRSQKITTRMMTPKLASWDGNVSLNVNSPGSNKLVVFHNHRTVAAVKGPKRSASFTSRVLGMGPTRLLIAGLGETNLDNVFAQPVTLDVGPGRTMRAQPVPIGTASKDGVLAIRKDGSRISIPKTTKNWLRTAKIKQGEPFQLGGIFSVRSTGIYQFQTLMNGDLILEVDDKKVFSLTNRNSYHRYESPLHLEKGVHTFRAKAATGKRHAMELKFGAKGTKPLAGPTFKHGI